MLVRAITLHRPFPNEVASSAAPNLQGPATVVCNRHFDPLSRGAVALKARIADLVSASQSHSELGWFPLPELRLLSLSGEMSASAQNSRWESGTKS
jgi:hypothetical protein